MSAQRKLLRGDFVMEDIPLPEVPWIPHLSQQVEEQHSTTISINDRVDALVSSKETFTTGSVARRRLARESADRLSAAGVTTWEVGGLSGES
jgi:hypothetical protein